MDPYLSPVEYRWHKTGHFQGVCLDKECFTTPPAESNTKPQAERAFCPTSEMLHKCLCENPGSSGTVSGFRTQDSDTWHGDPAGYGRTLRGTLWRWQSSSSAKLVFISVPREEASWSTPGIFTGWSPVGGGGIRASIIWVIMIEVVPFVLIGSDLGSHVKCCLCCNHL